MAAGAGIVASDLPAFMRVLDEGRAGALFPVGQSTALASAILGALGDEAKTERRRAHAKTWCQRYDWHVVTSSILDVYALAIGDDAPPAAEVVR